MARRSIAASGIEVTIELGLMAIDLLAHSYEVYLVLTAPDGGHIRASWLLFRPGRIASGKPRPATLASRSSAVPRPLTTSSSVSSPVVSVGLIEGVPATASDRPAASDDCTWV